MDKETSETEAKPTATPATFSRVKLIGKQVVFVLIIVGGFFGTLELGLGVFGIRPLVSTEDPLVGFSNIPLFVEKKQADGTITLNTAENKLLLFNIQSFPKLKTQNTYRIFCMGGSTTYGHPYTYRTSFCGWLQAFLQAADPSRNWEVINAGGISYASYRVTRLMSELTQYQPDMFIVYTGQNEFLEQRSYGRLQTLPHWLLHTDVLLSNTRTYTATKRVIDIFADKHPKKSSQPYRLNDEVDEVLDHTVGPTSYHRNDELKQQIIEHYRLNLQRMIDVARQAHTKIIFINPAVNLKDMSPFKSEHKTGLNQDALTRWNTLYQQGNDQNGHGQFQEAARLYEQALSIDDRYAELYYRLGQAQFALNEFDQAERSFWRAVDEDIAPLRILSTMRTEVAEIASWNRVPLLDFQQLLKETYQRQYRHTVLGKEFFVDHVHTNIEGYRLLGLTLLDQLIKEDIAKPNPAWGTDKITEVSGRVVAALDKKAHSMALWNLIRTLDWAGKLEEARNLCLQHLELYGPQTTTYILLGQNAHRRGHDDEAIGYFTQALALEPNVAWVHNSLAGIYRSNGKPDEAISHYLAELKIDNSNVVSHDRVGVLLAARGKSDEARQHFMEALRIRPDYEGAALNLATLLSKQGKNDEALAQAEKILAHNPNQAIAHNIIGIIMTERGQFDAAIDHFQAALRINPDYTSARQNLRQAEAMRTQRGY